ncbi:MAG TPA: FAD-dependent oxidoreductase, partial [Microbacteriaceae bacterium]|nr:FAD-dependent oxidoreductase [Microbacteriaceae bacterium]
QGTWRTVVDAVHAEGGRIALQLFHAGRYASERSFGLVPVAPSAVYSRFSRCMPEALTDDGIRRTIADFGAGAAVAARLGFDAIEVMGSEGYLINQFASPVTNKRDDAWGGDAERRRAFPVAVLQAVARAAGGLPVIARTSAADLIEGSSTPDEADALAVALVRAGAAAVSVGIGWHESRVPTVQTLVPHVAWGSVAGRMRAALRAAGEAVPLIASNRINTVLQAEHVLVKGQADMVSMARPFLADPHIVATSFAGNAAFVNPCIGCNEACIDRSFGLEPVSCTVNPRAGRELEFPSDTQGADPTGADLAARAEPLPGVVGRIVSSGVLGAGGRADAGAETKGSRRGPGLRDARRGRLVAVVGAGPAGMEAARAAAFAGARVCLFEAQERIGGQFLMAGLVPGKSDFIGTARYFERELRRRGVTVETGHAVAGAEELVGFDHVVLAAGVSPRRVTLPGLGLPGTPPVVAYPEAFRHPERIGRRVAVVGAGGIAVDVAHFLVEEPLPALPWEGQEEERRRRFRAAYRLSAEKAPAPAREITIMRRSGQIGAGMGLTTRWAVVQAIRAAGVRTLTGIRYVGVEAGGIRIAIDGEEELVAADTIVVAAGQVPNDGLAAQLAAANVAHTVIGGALMTSGTNAVAAFEQGLKAGDAAARNMPNSEYVGVE